MKVQVQLSVIMIAAKRVKAEGEAGVQYGLRGGRNDGRKVEGERRTAKVG